MVFLTKLDTLGQFLDLLTNTEFPEQVIVNFNNELEFAPVKISAVRTHAINAHAQIAGHCVG